MNMCIHNYFAVANPSLLCSTLPTLYHSLADKDYKTLEVYITFSARRTLASFNVEIYDDEEPEFPEEFYIDLMITPEAESRGVRRASPDTATVVIQDDDSEWCCKIQTLHTVHQ